MTTWGGDIVGLHP